jgi:hypothetical protein
MTWGFSGVDPASRQFPGLPEPVEDQQDTIAVPQRHQRKRQWRVSGRCLFGPGGEGGQGIATIVNGKGWAF